jgi:hypothetical protein
MSVVKNCLLVGLLSLFSIVASGCGSSDGTPSEVRGESTQSLLSLGPPASGARTTTCGLYCATGTHPTAYTQDQNCCVSAGCLPTSQTKVTCEADSAQFTKCGSGCPAHYAQTATSTNFNCRVPGSSGGSQNETAVTCTCNDATCCQKTTCAAHGATCGTIPDGCGGTLSCGTCGIGQVCNGNACICQTTCAAHGATCGTISDGCGGTLSCGTCASGQVCTNNNCCSPTTCAAQSKTCGTIPDGCGGSLSCGECASGQTCTGGSCVTCPNACPVGATRCGSTGVETCVAANGQCPTWTTTQVCGVRQACVVAASGAAACQCTSSCSQSSGCLDYYNLATCSVDANGCVYQTARNCYPAICASVYNSCYSYHY